MVEHMVPLLERATTSCVVLISSGGGSMTFARHDGRVLVKSPAHCTSKAALNMVALHYYHRFPGWKVNLCCPEFRVRKTTPRSLMTVCRLITRLALLQVTRLNHFGANFPALRPSPLEEGAVDAVRLSLLGKDGESGTYTRLEGKDGYAAISW